ncbi:1076_t:CDS:2, partial [Paraglomus occultum]
MATVAKSKPKRRSMPAIIGRLTNPFEKATDVEPPTLPSQPHILDLMLNEEFSNADLGLEDQEESTASEVNASTSIAVDQNSQRSADADEKDINNVLLSQDVIESLETVKKVALFALDGIVRQIAEDSLANSLNTSLGSSLETAKTSPKKKRSFSHSIAETSARLAELRRGREEWHKSQILEDIARNATMLGSKSEMQQIEPIQTSSTDVATMHRIQHQLKLNTPVVPSDDYSLACSLAALLGYLYRMQELCEADIPQSERNNNQRADTTNADEMIRITNNENIYATLRKEVTNLQNHRQNLALKTQEHNLPAERLDTWNEIDRLMDLIARLCRERSINEPPPRYSVAIDEKDRAFHIDPPKYSSLYNEKTTRKVDNEKTRHDLDNVISAIERVYSVAPQLNNQRVELSHRQTKELTAATLSTAIQRLSRGRYEEQRACFNTVTKYQTLNRLVEQISKSASRSFVDQRVELSPRQLRHIEAARLNCVIDRLGRNRMTDQDWHPPEQLLVQDLTRITNELTETSYNSAYAAQRFHLTSAKERDMFMNSVIKKVEKMGSYRLNNQDADPPAQRRERALQEIDQIVGKMAYSPVMDSQRAIRT